MWGALHQAEPPTAPGARGISRIPKPAHTRAQPTAAVPTVVREVFAMSCHVMCHVPCHVMRLLNPVRTRGHATELSQDPLNVTHSSYELVTFPCSSCARTVTVSNIPSFLVPRPTFREAYAARSLLLVFCCNVHLDACLKNLRCAVADGKLVCETFTQFGFDVFGAHFDEAVTKVGSHIVVINEFEKSDLALAS